MAFDTTQPNYVSFRNIVAEGTTGIVAWVGAGLSRAAGLPTWGQLKGALQSTLRKNASTFDDPDRDNTLRKAEAIEKVSDLWLAFQMLEEALGGTTFKDTIREQLKEVPHARTPETYRFLWKLPINGVLNLNLDRIATRAYGESAKESPPLEFTGFQLENVANVLKSPRPFILNLHGIAEDSSSWVLTRKQLKALTNREGYRSFIEACLLTRTILFVGITANDIAVGGHLDRLLQKTKDFGTHFWITDRRDSPTDTWAEERNIRVIRYKPQGDNHTALNDFFNDLLNFIPSDDTPPPVVSAFTVPSANIETVSPENLVHEDAEAIRKILNAKAKQILESNGDLEQFDDFCSKYDEAIYRAWYTTARPGKNTLFGYELRKQVAKGAFGTVYNAVDKVGKEVAVKILNEELRTHKEMLESFRRGVRSMRILKDRRVTGMVPYLDASEIPAVVVMDWVNGPNLKEAVESKFLTDWNSRLFVGTSLAKIVRSAHMLPERVLHRDLRPPNIMLKGYYEDPLSFDIVVLDFDLSWHLGATEKSILVSSATGYLAPEQLAPIHGISTRHSSVDAFGLGMCLFFLVGERDPLPAEHAHANWQETVMHACRRNLCAEWASLPERYGRAILNSTKPRQSERWDMAQIQGELERLKYAFDEPEAVMSAELLAEELVARSCYGKGYEWKEDGICAQIVLPSGLAIRVSGNEAASRLELEIGWIGSGEHSRKKVIKWLPGARQKVKDLLLGHNWKILGDSSWSEQVEYKAAISANSVPKNLTAFSEMIEKAAMALRFE